MSFQVSDIPGQPVLCCNRTLAEQCISIVPLVDHIFGNCTIVQAVDPFATFNKHTAAPLIFLLDHPAWIGWLG
jgi:hypothetical protein